MAFNGNEGEVVSLTKAAAWTSEFRNANPTAIKAHFFGKNKINDILNQPGVVGIRFFHGQETNGTQNLIMVGTDANENDITTGTLVEYAVNCPDQCGQPNELNS